MNADDTTEGVTEIGGAAFFNSRPLRSIIDLNIVASSIANIFMFLRECLKHTNSILFLERLNIL